MTISEEAAFEPPTDWIDPDMGHRVFRLSTEPGSASLYFHQNAYTPDGQRLIVTTPTGLSTIDLKTGTIAPIVTDRVNVIVTGRKTGNVYYVRDGMICATNVDTHDTRQMGRLPPGGSVGTLNADESRLAGAITTEDGGRRPAQDAGPEDELLSRADAIEMRLFNRLEGRHPIR